MTTRWGKTGLEVRTQWVDEKSTGKKPVGVVTFDASRAVDMAAANAEAASLAAALSDALKQEGWQVRLEKKPAQAHPADMEHTIVDIPLESRHPGEMSVTFPGVVNESLFDRVVTKLLKANGCVVNEPASNKPAAMQTQRPMQLAILRAARETVREMEHEKFVSFHDDEHRTSFIARLQASLIDKLAPPHAQNHVRGGR